MPANNHLLNILSFPAPAEPKEFQFITEKTEGYKPLRKAEYPFALWQKHEEELQDCKRLYCNFTINGQADFSAEVDLTKSSNFGIHYFNHLIRSHFEGVADMVYPNFVEIFPSLNSFIKQPFHMEKEDSIAFDSMDNVVDEVRNRLRTKEKAKNTRYVALYVSPVTKETANEQQKNVYYALKELLLQHGITSQVIYKERVYDKYFGYYLPNIAIALLGKLEGIPWRLNRTKKEDLIVGVGAFYSETDKHKYVGSAFCFDNEGVFKEFDCFPSDRTDMLAGSIRKAVMRYIVEHETAERLIIHFYKRISDRELQPIISTLHKLGLNIPVIVVSINKTESKDLIAFDTSAGDLMPVSGTIIQTGHRQYLLFNNTKYNPKFTVKDWPFPIKLELTSKDDNLLNDIANVKELIDQVYQFSRMYWKSVKQQNLPVTIKYPEMVAEMFPHFESDIIPPFGKNNLWFL